MREEAIRKNHMDILWHEYTDQNGENKPVTEASLTEKASIIGRVGRMACEKFYECAGRSDGDYLYSGYRFDVDRIYML